ncbi:winged helix-turn-helix transcriptional regulator [Pseudobacter ginsenosidimutans]|jgi:DNA-binding HxlR family transcriptional regulator|uniref:HxlR family transcriptional regulator n=1 Tax=Pseudobacter ginsenosidimutans TaxID=661488 RepID=A0A4Q7N292_9BACT|nr:helix-turn-helix domain-containing protein [Pseudobacter ginsenosidimutans]QEC43440.1 helix-turn-helix transcriptional regulator [Pseudobacter ginsenosidimutans]RZS74824.1 HxlR family transcriptional regulator [Pseudobacter ginsenosidimutans]
MRKTNSTNSINEEVMLARCGMSYTLSVIGGRWKPAILFTLLKGRMRYNELRKSIDGVSERMLVAQLRELEADGLVSRIIYPEVPPRVEYELTATGKDTAPMLRQMSAWGNRHRAIQQTTPQKKKQLKKAS